MQARIVTAATLAVVLAAAGATRLQPVSAAPAVPSSQESFFAWSALQFPAREYAQRRQRLVERLQAAGGGVFLAPARPGASDGETYRQLDDFLYFTGLEVPDSVLAVDADRGTTSLFVPAQDTRFTNPSRANDFPGRGLLEDPQIASRSGIDTVRSIDELSQRLGQWAPSRALWLDPGRAGPLVPRPLRPVDRIGPAENLIAYVRARYPQARLLNAYPEIAQLRMVKSDAEIEAIWDAVQATNVSIRRAVGILRPGIDERSLQGEFEAGCRAHGAQRLPFTPIVKSGPNSLWPWRLLAAHYDRRNRSMQSGELVIFDVGCERDYYVADVGRTFPVSGRFTPQQKRILQMQLRVADAIIAAIRPGATLAQLQRVGVAAIPEKERRYMQAGPYFGHHIGLSAGDPFLAETPLDAGMVITVEPWYYNHDQGVAVFTEDVIAVTEDGARNLSASLPRQPDGLARLVPPLVSR